jgi:hypothetical protein
MRSGALTDFTVKFGDEERRVHRVLLANHSKYFRKLFNSNFVARMLLIVLEVRQLTL